jgi:hypothetical protein
MLLHIDRTKIYYNLNRKEGTLNAINLTDHHYHSKEEYNYILINQKAIVKIMIMIIKVIITIVYYKCNRVRVKVT